MQDAFHQVLPQGSQDLFPSMPSLDDSVDELVGEAGPSGFQPFRSLVPSTSTSPTDSTQSIQSAALASTKCDLRTSGSKMINFTIILDDTRASILVKRLQILNYLKNNLINLHQVLENQTVGTIKAMIFSAFGIPVSQQELTGWKLNKPPRDNTVLETLDLPVENTLYLSVNGNGGANERYTSGFIFRFQIIILISTL